MNPSFVTRMNASRLLFGSLSLWATLTASAQVVITESYTPNLAIPDGSIEGIAHTVSLPATIGSITSVTVELNLSGGFTGDYYAYLRHDTGFSVLLNRPGRTSNSGEGSLGYLDGGFHVTFDDTASNGDIHFYQSLSHPGSGSLTGTWAPDGRHTSPSTVTGVEPRDATLATFHGLASGGDWTLFVADLSSGGVGTLHGWTLSVTGTPVPEPETWAGLVGLSLLAFAAVRQRRR